MIGILERRLTIERLLAAARQDDQVAARRALDAALVQAERDGGREGSMIAGGLLQLLGGTVLLPSALLAEMPPGAVMGIEWTLEGLRLKAAALPPELAELVRRLSAEGREVEVVPVALTAPLADQAPPPANPTEDSRHARVRICNAVRTFVQRHYDGEIRGRRLRIHGQRVRGAVLDGDRRVGRQRPDARPDHRAAVRGAPARPRDAQRALPAGRRGHPRRPEPVRRPGRAAAGRWFHPAALRGDMDTTLVPTPFTPTPGQPYRLEDLEPLRDRIIVAPLAVASRTTGGIHLVETGTQRERPQHGIVLALGPGAWTADKTGRVPMQVRVGDCIFYGKYSGQEFELAGQKVLNMGEAEVFTVLRQGRFALVTHEDPKLNHLQGDYCDLCATPAEADAKAALEAERARLVQSRQELEA